MKIALQHLVLGAAVAAMGLATLGCAGPDLTMPNPIVSGSLPQNRVVKGHGFAESRSGLPVGSMADEAVVDALDKNQVCVNVVLHELSEIDITNAEVKFTTSTGTLLQPQLSAESPTKHTYQGLVPHTQQTGARIVCNSTDTQTTCHSEPIYTTTMIPGPVDVFSTKGRVCAPNQNLVTVATKDMALKISTPTAGPGVMGMGHGAKSTTFRWAFQ
jgi:hypothetical protein